MQATVEAPSGYLISCVTYIVASQYAVWDRQSDGTYAFTEASASAPELVHTGCPDSNPTATVQIEAISRFPAGSSERFILGYTVETVPGVVHSPPEPAL